MHSTWYVPGPFSRLSPRNLRQDSKIISRFNKPPNLSCSHRDALCTTAGLYAGLCPIGIVMCKKKYVVLGGYLPQKHGMGASLYTLPPSSNCPHSPRFARGPCYLSF